MLTGTVRLRRNRTHLVIMMGRAPRDVVSNVGTESAGSMSLTEQEEGSTE
jgi:hypothetical protein